LDSIHEEVKAAAGALHLELAQQKLSPGEAPPPEDDGKEVAKFADTICPSCVTFRFVE